MAVAVAQPALLLLFLIASSSMLPWVTLASEYTLAVSGPTLLELSPSLMVENSPGSKPGIAMRCARVEIHGLSRIKHLQEFASSVKVKVAYINQTGRAPNIEVCFHRNVSLGIGMCPHNHWEKLSKGLWLRTMSPFDYKILDIRVAKSYSNGLQVSLDEELFFYRITFLVLGTVLMTLAPWLSKSLTFYYSGAMTIGILLVILIVLFQGMKLLPTGRSSLAILLYSFFIGVGSFLLRYVPSLLRSLVSAFGFPEDTHHPLATSLLVLIVIIGAWLGFWVVHKLVLKEDGSIDLRVSKFVTWSIRIVSSAMILQSSVDPLLAAELLIGVIAVSSLLRRSVQPKVLRRASKSVKSRRPNKTNHEEPRDLYTSPAAELDTPLQGSTGKPHTMLSESNTFYSSFHRIPDRMKLTKAEWKSFTRDSTRKALAELFSSPDFSMWAVSHADSLTLAAPPRETALKTRRWFNWL